VEDTEKRREKNSSYLLTVSGKIKGSGRCITLIETPQVNTSFFSKADFTAAARLLRTAFYMIIIIRLRTFIDFSKLIQNTHYNNTMKLKNE
jgi:hypothetical protein